MDSRDLRLFIAEWPRASYFESFNNGAFLLAIHNGRFDEAFHAATGLGYRWDATTPRGLTRQLTALLP